jgi:hypothetical protein
VNRNFQTGIHPDADQLSVFAEGAATAPEQKRMLAHLAGCTECREAVFLMQPHGETQRTAAAPAKRWVWRWLVPVGVPAAALACGLIAVFIYTRPHGAASSIPQQVASARQPEIAGPGHGTAVAPTTNSEKGTQVERPKGDSTPKAAGTDIARQKNRVAGGTKLPASKLPESKSDQKTSNAARPLMQTEQADMATPFDKNLVENLPNGGAINSAGGYGNFQVDKNHNDEKAGDVQKANKEHGSTAAQDSVAMKKDLPALQVQGDQSATLAGVVGRVTDPSGAVVAGVTVTVRDASGKIRQTTTGADGSFSLTELPAGQYLVTATATGFKANIQKINLQPSELATLQPRMALGAAGTTIEVSGVAPLMETEQADMSTTFDRNLVENLPNGGNDLAAVAVTNPVIPVFGPPVAATVSHGKRFVSLDSAGSLFLSRNGGKKWKKVNPQWAGKAMRIELTPAYRSEAPPKAKNETLAPASEGAVFQLTTDAGAVWTSKDGMHWHRQ